MGWRAQVWFLAGKNVSLSSTLSRRALGPIQPPIQWAPSVKRPGHEADHSAPSSAKVKNSAAMLTLPLCVQGIGKALIKQTDHFTFLWSGLYLSHANDEAPTIAGTDLQFSLPSLKQMRITTELGQCQTESYSLTIQTEQILGVCTLSIIKNSKYQTTQCSGNWICFQKRETSTLLDPLERANLNHWVQALNRVRVSLPSP
jgi:hypothetical protein